MLKTGNFWQIQSNYFEESKQASMTAWNCNYCPLSIGMQLERDHVIENARVDNKKFSNFL